MENTTNSFSKELLSTLRTSLHLQGMADAYELQLLNESAFSQLPFDQRLHDLVEREICSKNERKYKRLLKQANLKYEIAFNGTNFTPGDGISPEDLGYLVSCNWYFTSKANIVIQGSCGTGKTTLACCILNNMLQQGMHVYFLRDGDFSYNVNIYEKDPAEQKKYLDKLVKYEVLALDDFGSSMYNENIERFLFELIARRLPTRPIVITSQKNVIDYLSLLGGDSRAEAIVDRLLKPCKVITLVGKSKREILK